MLYTAVITRFRAALALEQIITAGICRLWRPEVLTKSRWQQKVEGSLLNGLFGVGPARNNPFMRPPVEFKGLPHANASFRAGAVQKE
jgi:hypothetical protein